MEFSIGKTTIKLINLIPKNNINNYWRGTFHFHNYHKGKEQCSYTYCLGLVFIKVSRKFK